MPVCLNKKSPERREAPRQTKPMSYAQVTSPTRTPHKQAVKLSGAPYEQDVAHAADSSERRYFCS